MKPSTQSTITRPPKSPAKVVIVEDEIWLRDNLAMEINANQEMRCVKSYGTAEEALEGIPNDRPDVVIMDINLPGINGVECLRRLKSIMPEVQFLMLTAFEESDKIFNSLLAGANGYLLKRTSTAELLEAIRQVRDGGAPMSSSIARRVVAYFNKIGERKPEASELSLREQEVLELLAKGSAYKAIGDKMHLSIDTVRMYVKHIYSKLHVHSRCEATEKYLQHPNLRLFDSK